MFNLTLTKSVRKSHQPNKSQINSWIQHALVKQFIQVNVEVLIVDSQKSQQINNQYRQINQSTNVIALEYKESREEFSILTGELILCDSIIVAEAKLANKLIIDHYAHMIIHGVLHLQGYDHQTTAEAKQMEKLEIEILQKLGMSNPY